MLTAVSELVNYQPLWLYQLKPFLLALASLFAYPLAPVSAVLLLAAGVMIFGMRRRWW